MPVSKWDRRGKWQKDQSWCHWAEINQRETELHQGDLQFGVTLGLQQMWITYVHDQDVPAALPSECRRLLQRCTLQRESSWKPQRKQAQQGTIATSHQQEKAHKKHWMIKSHPMAIRKYLTDEVAWPEATGPGKYPNWSSVTSSMTTTIYFKNQHVNLMSWKWTICKKELESSQAGPAFVQVPDTGMLCEVGSAY